MGNFIKILFLLVGVLSYGQQITVIDKDSRFPIKGVSISNKEKSKIIYTNSEGKADIATLKNDDFIFIYHYLYEKQKYGIASILLKNGIIELEKPTEKLDEVVLSVSKGRENKNRIAEQTIIFTASEIQKLSPQTSADLLATSPGVKVQKTQFGGGSPVLRGMESNRVLLVVDGVRMNNAIYRKGHLQNTITVSPSMLDRVEVVFGPSSMIYGSDALGGVIHYYTKELKTSEFRDVNSSVFTRFSSVNDEVTTHVDTELSFSKWASYTSFSYSNFGDLKMGSRRSHGYGNWGKNNLYSDNSISSYSKFPSVNQNPNIQKNTGYSQKDFLQKLFFPVSNEVELMFNLQYSRSSNIPRYDRLNEYKDGSLKFAEWYYGPQKRFMLSTQVKLHEINKWIEKGTITLAYQDIEESRIQRKFGSLERTNRIEGVGVFSLNGDFTIPLTKDKNRNLSYGFEVVYNRVGSESRGDNLVLNALETDIESVNRNAFDVQTRYPDDGSSYITEAVYLGYRQDLNKKHTLNTGVRFTGTQLNAKWIFNPQKINLPSTSISLQNSAFTATIGHVFKPTNDFRITSILSSGFRSPNIDDIGKIREKNGFVTVPNINLKPEYAYNAEVGVLKYFNNRMMTFGANLYYTLLNNFIIRAPFNTNTNTEGNSTIDFDGETDLVVVANVNRGRAFVKGGTINFQGEINENWFTSGGVTYTYGRTYVTRDPLSSIPPLFCDFSLGYKLNKLETVFRYEYNAAKKTSEYNIYEGIDNIEQTPIRDQNTTDLTGKYAGTPSWQIFNLSFLYELNAKTNVQVKVQNILDQHYKEFASGISAAGRNFSASVKYAF